MLGYALIVPDIDMEMLENIALNDCAKYSNIYELNVVDSEFKIVGKKRNISSTYDGFKIVSQKFKAFCENQKYTGLEFIELPQEPKYYWFKVNNIVHYDIEARGVKFLNYNEFCDGFEEIIGAHPVCLMSNSVLEETSNRKDLSLGSYAR